MSAALPSLWRLELTVPHSIASTTSLVEVHLLLERDADQSFVQPAATSAANGVTSSVGSAVFSPITNSDQLAPLFPANNVALNYSRTASASETLLAALFSSSPTTNVQLNYLMRQQPDAGHYSIDYIAFQPQLNQSLWSPHLIKSAHSQAVVATSLLTPQSDPHSILLLFVCLCQVLLYCPYWRSWSGH